MFYEERLIGGAWHYRTIPDGVWILKAVNKPCDGTTLEQRWQKVDTAPKDGTDVLLLRFAPNCQEGKHGRMAVDFWHQIKKHGYEGWGKFNAKFWPATHWMPLPPLPKED